MNAKGTRFILRGLMGINTQPRTQDRIAPKIANRGPVSYQPRGNMQDLQSSPCGTIGSKVGPSISGFLVLASGEIVGALSFFIFIDQVHYNLPGSVKLGESVPEGIMSLVLVQEGISFPEFIVLGDNALE